MDHLFVKQTEAQHCTELFLTAPNVIRLPWRENMECMEMFTISKMKSKPLLEKKILAPQMSMITAMDFVMGF